jgi:hypothetical protein
MRPTAAVAFRRLAGAMAKVAAEATRAGEALAQARRQFPTLSGSPEADAQTIATHVATQHRRLPS